MDSGSGPVKVLLFKNLLISKKMNYCYDYEQKYYNIKKNNNFYLF